MYSDISQFSQNLDKETLALKQQNPISLSEKWGLGILPWHPRLRVHSFKGKRTGNHLFSQCFFMFGVCAPGVWFCLHCAWQRFTHKYNVKIEEV